jgi:hypothetical protein
VLGAGGGSGGSGRGGTRTVPGSTHMADRGRALGRMRPSLEEGREGNTMAGSGVSAKGVVAAGRMRQQQRPVWMAVAGWESEAGREWKGVEPQGQRRDESGQWDESASRRHRLQGRHVVGAVGAAHTVGHQGRHPVMYQRRRAGTEACSLQSKEHRLQRCQRKRGSHPPPRSAHRPLTGLARALTTYTIALLALAPGPAHLATTTTTTTIRATTTATTATTVRPSRPAGGRSAPAGEANR